jgi:glutathione S-transferase
MARSIVAEMHSGFGALRGECAMNLEYQWVGFEPSENVLADCMRMEQLWDMARKAHGQNGPWLFGDYSIADAFFAPAATRFVTYNLPRSDAAQAYIDTHLNDKTFRRWRAMGLAQNYRQEFYNMHLPTTDWPGPTPLPAKPVDTGPSENATCPYSGEPVTHHLELNGRTFGFCNAFCRDKTLADAEAWDGFMEIYAFS